MATSIEESGFRSTFFEGILHPVVEGYAWYRGYWILQDPKNGVLIFTPWIWPQDTRPPLILIVGEPNQNWVSQIVRCYIQGANNWLNSVSPKPKVEPVESVENHSVH
jgi:hypothetical protein